MKRLKCCFVISRNKHALLFVCLLAVGVCSPEQESVRDFQLAHVHKRLQSHKPKAGILVSACACVTTARRTHDVRSERNSPVVAWDITTAPHTCLRTAHTYADRQSGRHDHHDRPRLRPMQDRCSRLLGASFQDAPIPKSVPSPPASFGLLCWTETEASPFSAEQNKSRTRPRSAPSNRKSEPASPIATLRG